VSDFVDDAAVVLVVVEVLDVDVLDDVLDVSDVEPSEADHAVVAVVALVDADVDAGVVVVLVVDEPSVADWRATAIPVPSPRKTAALETAVASRARRAGCRRRGRIGGGSF
jgi:hypothetical protein